MDLPDTRILLSTFPSENDANGVIRHLLEERLIACGTMLPGARSLYRWEGQVEETVETIVLLKTNQENAARCMVLLEELHPYEVPEIILLEPEAVSVPYTSWVGKALAK